VVTIVRLWLGVVWLLTGAVEIFWGPIAIAGGDYGGVYWFFGGLTMAVVGWVVHPWGLQRRRRNRRVPITM
jgi:hypothetical protein